MRPVTATLALTLFVLGCSPSKGQGVEGEPVEILTGVEACYAGGQSPNDHGLLVPDPEFGTRFDGRGPVMWPVGYTGIRLAEGHVAVLNAQGGVVATTGKTYSFSPVPGQPGAALGAVPVCDSYPWDFVDCAAVADGTGDPAEAPYCPPPPPAYDLEAVKANFEDACEDPSVLEGEACERIDVDGMRGSDVDLIVPTTGLHFHPKRAQDVCEQIASAYLDLDGEPLGYGIVIIEGKNNKQLAECTVDA